MMMLLLQTMLAENVIVHGSQGEVSNITTGAISAVVGAIVTGLALYFKTKSKVTVDGEVNVKESAGRQRRQEVSWTEVKDLKDRVKHIELKVDEMKSAQGDQFKAIITSAYEREIRLGEKLDKGITGVHERMDDLFTALALPVKPTKK